MPFGQKLKSLRQARKWSRERLSLCTKGIVSPSAIKQLESRAGREPRKGTRLALAEVFPELGA